MRSSVLSYAALGLAAAACLAFAGAALADDALVDPSVAAGSLSGKRVLISPYNMENFNTANTSWVTRLLEPYGVKTDVANPNGSSSKQLDNLETAIASQNYNIIIWQPIDPDTADTTIRKIQDAKIGQILQFAPKDIGGMHYSTTSVDWTKTYVSAGAAAATFIAKHPDLGPPQVAWIGQYPASQQCNDRLQGFMDGIKSVSPDAKIVYNEGVTTAEQSRSKITDLITRGTAFNIFSACNGGMALGGIAALQAANLAGAVNKVPQHVYIATMDGSPPELQLLWDQNSAVMRVGLFGPKTAAIADAKMAINLLTGKVPFDGEAEEFANVSWLTPDCDTYRAQALEQFQGVEGFTVPACSFKYTGND